METRNSIICAINYDIERGIYDQFPILRNRLTKIQDKLLRRVYVVNSERLTPNDLQTLIENEYISPSDVPEL